MSSITWDEETIAEHDKLRGTRQKIDEPNTPFERNVKPHDDKDCDAAAMKNSPNHDKDDVGHNWEALNAKLNFESMQQKEKDRETAHEISIGECTNDEEGNTYDSQEEGEEGDGQGAKKRGAPEGSPEEAKQNFADKRAAHYNEFLVLKALKQKDLEEDEDKDEEA